MAAALLVTGGRKLPNATDKLISEVASDCITYNGRTENQDALTSEAVWQISRTIYAGGFTITQFAFNAEFTGVWDDRATYFDPPGACTPPFPYPHQIISDGTNTLLVNPDGSINTTATVTLSHSVSTQTLFNLSMPLANTVYSYTFPAGTKRYTFASRSRTSFRMALTSLETATNYVSIFGVYSQELLDGSVTRTLYFLSESPGQVLEIDSWA